MEVKLDQKQLEEAIIAKAVDQIFAGDEAFYDRISHEVDRKVSDAIAKGLNGQIEKTINSIMERALDTEIQPVNTWGEREGKPTTVRGALHERAKNFWSENVDAKGEKSTYGGRPRYEHIIGLMTAKEFDNAIKQNIINIAGAVKDAVRDGLYKTVDEKLNELFKIKSLGDQKKPA